MLLDPTIWRPISVYFSPAEVYDCFLSVVMDFFFEQKSIQENRLYLEKIDFSKRNFFLAQENRLYLENFQPHTKILLQI